MDAVAGLGECARTLSRPSNLRTYLQFRPDGTTAQVAVLRASTDDCAAIDCVRRKLSQVRVTTVPAFPHVTGIDFTLSDHPRLDTTTLMDWDAGSVSDKCTDPRFSTTSQLSRQALDAGMAGHQDTLMACYRRGLDRDPGLHGLVVIRGVANAQGKLQSLVVVENQLAACDVVACLRNELATITFPPAGEPLSFGFNFVFKPDTPKPTTQLW